MQEASGQKLKPKKEQLNKIKEVLNQDYNLNLSDKEVLDTVSRLRSRGIKCCIATRQEKYRSRYLLETLGLRKYFDGAFITCDIGYDKSQVEFWEYVFKELEVKPEEIMFFDDTTKNIQFTESLGVKAIFYENINTLQKHTTFP